MGVWVGKGVGLATAMRRTRVGVGSGRLSAPLAKATLTNPLTSIKIKDPTNAPHRRRRCFFIGTPGRPGVWGGGDMVVAIPGSMRALAHRTAAQTKT